MAMNRWCVSSARLIPEPKVKINLGCGNDYREGYINCDVSDKVKTDKVFDLEEEFPFPENSVDEVLANHVLEHIGAFIELMHDIHFSCKPNAMIEIRVPFYSSWGQYNDPTHRRFFTPFTFNYFQKNIYGHEVGADKDMFKVEKTKIIFGVGSLSKLNFIFNPLINSNHKVYCRFFAWIFPATEIYFELKVIKEDKNG